MQRIALVNMPFASIYRPSIGLGLLKAALVRDGHHVDVFNFNLDFAEQVGFEAYSLLASIPSSLIGEWVFADALNGAPGDDDAFFAGFGAEHASTRLQFTAMRDRAEPFLDRCMAAAHWAGYDLVGFTSVFEQTTASLALAHRIKAAAPAVKIALGGSNAEGEMGLALLNAYPVLDIVCSGEGDVAFPRYVNALDAGEDVAIPGILRAGRNRLPSTAPSVHAMDDLPHPDYTEYFEAFVSKSYGPAEIAKTDIPFESSRGCWWGVKSHCKFCGLNGSNMAFRSKGAERVLEEVTALKGRYQAYTSRFFAVDNIIDYKYFSTLLPAIKERGIDLDLFYETKANLSRDQVRLLRDAFIRRIQPGIESLSSSVLKLMGKGVSALQNVQLLKLCKEFGIVPVWNVLYGLPGEAPEEYGRVAKLVPALTHLDPPTGWYKIRLDRFSPYFNKSDENGLVNVRPFSQYGMVHHRLTEEQHAGIAYYFDYDYADGREPLDYAQPMIEQLQVWLDPARRGYLFSDVVDETLYLFSFRAGLRRELVALAGLDRAIYELLDRPRGFGVLEQLLEKGGHEIAADAVRARLDALEARALVMREDDNYLALAIRVGEYQPPQAVLDAFRSGVERMRAQALALAA